MAKSFCLAVDERIEHLIDRKYVEAGDTSGDARAFPAVTNLHYLPEYACNFRKLRREGWIDGDSSIDHASSGTARRRRSVWVSVVGHRKRCRRQLSWEPSTRNWSPTMKAAASEARKTTALAISSGSA